MRMFGRPQGALGRLGGSITARANYDCGAWLIELLEVRSNGRVLEVGFGSGVVIQRVAVAACVADVDSLARDG
jgi:protein-L-isoaspartate O-methyltransferase